MLTLKQVLLNQLKQIILQLLNDTRFNLIKAPKET